MLKSYPGSYAILALLAVVLAGAIASTALLTAPARQRVAVTVTNETFNIGTQRIATGNPWLDNPLYCEKDADCTLQITSCNDCSCGKPINVQSQTAAVCTENYVDCDSACPPVTLHCINNQCAAKSKSNWQVVNNLDIVHQQFTFDGCGQISDYEEYDWYSELASKASKAGFEPNEISELCYSENGQMAVFIVHGSYCQSGDIYRLDIGKDNLLQANVIDHDRGCLAGFKEFGKRIGNIIKVIGSGGDAGCTAEMYYDYNFLSNYVELVSEYDWCIDDGGRNNGTWTYHAGSLCEDEPKITGIGRELYPTDPKYATDLNYLGELFTAAECGTARLEKIFGVNDNQYSLGSSLRIATEPSPELIDILQSIGYFCTIKTSPYACTEWELLQPAPLEDILKLKPYYKELLRDDCLGCG
jgi:hypothetical protein